jgi:plastocyanin
MPMIVFLPKHFAEVNSNPITFPESEDNMPTAALPETMNINVTPALIKVKPGQELTFTNDPKQFPEFEIKFLGASPASPDDDLTGTHKVTIHVVKTGTFPYMIIHTQPPHAERPHAEAAFAERPHPEKKFALAAFAEAVGNLHTGVFSIRSCTGGCP